MSVLNKKEVDETRKILEEFKPVVGYYEKEILLPQIKGRLEYLITIFNQFKTVASDQDVATHIDAAIRQVSDEKKIDLKGLEPAVGKAYLGEVSRQVDKEYIEPLEKLLAEEFSDLEAISNDYSKIIDVMNRTYNEIQSIVACKDLLFKYSMKSFPNLKHTKTQEVILGEPVEVTLSLMPFETRLAELVNVVDTTMGSIKSWTESIRDQRKKNNELMIKLTEIKSVKENQKYQLILIIVSLILIVLGFTLGFSGNKYLETKKLQDELIESNVLLDGLKNEKAILILDKDKLSKRVEELEKKQP